MINAQLWRTSVGVLPRRGEHRQSVGESQSVSQWVAILKMVPSRVGTGKTKRILKLRWWLWWWTIEQGNVLIFYRPISVKNDWRNNLIREWVYKNYFKILRPRRNAQSAVDKSLEKNMSSLWSTQSTLISKAKILLNSIQRLECHWWKLWGCEEFPGNLVLFISLYLSMSIK